MAAMPDAIAPLIDKNSPITSPKQFRVAAFYSISNCEPGLRGVSLGNFLISGCRGSAGGTAATEDLLHAVADPRFHGVAGPRGKAALVYDGLKPAR